MVADDTVLPYPFTTADELLAICDRERKSISDIMLANELVWRSEPNSARSCSGTLGRHARMRRQRLRRRGDPSRRAERHPPGAVAIQDALGHRRGTERRGLEGTAIQCSPIDDRVLGNYFSRFISDGFVAPPPAAVTTA